MILHPDMNEPVLRQPGSGLVVRAEAPAALMVEVAPGKGGDSTAAVVKVEALTPEAGTESAPEPRKPSGRREDVRILGHVAGLGDVTVGANEWIAGPSAPSRIEGLAIEWPSRPPNLSIRYAVRVGQSGLTPMTEIGSFAGTRRRALSLTGAVLELSGEGAPEFQLSVEALFLGSPSTRTTGQRIIIGGPTGREPLVGIRLNLEPVDKPDQPITPPVQKGRPSGRVRVFRGRGNQAKPAA